MMSRMPRRLATAFVLALPALAPAQAPVRAGTPVHLEERVLHSSIDGRRYRLSVALPEGYAARDTTRYPVLYVLDGIAFARLAAEEVRMLRFVGAVRDVIVVGVDYDVPSMLATQGPRYDDLTPSRDSASDDAFTRRLRSTMPDATARSGGAERFLRVLERDVIPAIATRYRVTDDRGLWGHSLGGLFASWVLLAHPASFARYGISSPTLAWNDRELFAREAAYARAHDTLAAHVYLSVGADQGPDDATRFAAALGARGYRRLDLASHVFEGETHASVVPSALSRALRYLYAAPARRPVAAP